MKKVIFSLILSLIINQNIFSATAEDSKIFTPYFDMSLTQSGYIPSNGNIFSGANINTQVGLLSKIAEKHSIFSLYTFDYSGPGFHPQDTKQFTERTMSHNFNFEYRYNINEKFRIRPGFSISNEYRRLGSNESWKNGLYNANSKGPQIALDWTFDFERNGYVTFNILSRSIEFPNYTDLLTEFMKGSSSGELSGGLQDQSFIQYSIRPGWNNFFGGIALTTQKYKNQKIVEISGVYGDTKQKDTDTTMDFGFHHSFWIFELYPVISYTIHKSNQNFMRYKSPTDTNPYFVKDAYSYKEFTFSIPLDLNITSKWAIGGAISTTIRNYDNRPPRDENNDYKSGKQYNTMSTITGSIKKKINELASVRFFYSIVIANSNNKFESYMPYNYTGNSFGLTYTISY